MTIIVDTESSERSFRDLQDEALHDDFSASKYRALVKRELNAGLRRVARRVRIPELEMAVQINTIAGTREYAQDPSVARINSLRHTSEVLPLEEIDIEEIDNAPTSIAKPTAFAFVGLNLALSPTPDATYALEARVQGLPEELVQDDDDVQLPEEYTDLAVSWARSRLFRLEDDFEMSAAWRADFEAELAEMKGQLAMKSRGRSRQLPRMHDRVERGPRFVRPA